jgi:hypothetical protein
MPAEESFSYSVSINGKGWCWEVILRGRVIGRGLTSTQSRAYVAAFSAALAYPEGASVGRRSQKSAIDRSAYT